MKSLVYQFFLLSFILLILSENAQNADKPGWSGVPVVPLSDFVNPATWHVNSSQGDNCSLARDSSDERSIVLHWKFGTGTGHKYAQIYFVFDEPVSFSDLDMVGIDIHGCYINSGCGNFDVQLKLENQTSASNATCKWNNLARLDRWCENISKLKSQFNVNSFQWDRVKVVSLEINTDQNFDAPVEGEVRFRNLSYTSISQWERATSFEDLNNSSQELLQIDRILLDSICSRQAPTGLLVTWNEDQSSWLYGQGLALKILSQCADRKAVSDDSAKYKNVTTQLAYFLINHQDPMGFWPRAWNSGSGTIRQNIEDDGSIWFGDFPWPLIGLQNYFIHSSDLSALPAIHKAYHFLTDSLIDSNGKLYTLKKYGQNFRKLPVTSVEAYSAVILSLLEMGDKERAVACAKYIDSLTWDSSLRYWKEGIYSSRVVLFGNTWFALLIRDNKCIAEAVDPTYQKSKDALTLVGKVLYTRGPGGPIGFDGIGPVANWFEGSFSYICAGGPGSQMVFDSLVSYMEPNFGVPHYNDDVSCSIGEIWAARWYSLDGTSWLHYTVSKSSPFVVDSVTSHSDVARIVSNPSFSVYPNPVNQDLYLQLPSNENGSFFNIYDVNGQIRSTAKVSGKLTKIDLSGYCPGVYFIEMVHNDNVFVRRIIKK